MNSTVLKRLCKIVPVVISGALLVIVGSHASDIQAPASSADQQGAAVQTAAPSLLAKFDGTVDTKSAKSGAVVIARSTKELKLADLDIPKGSKIIGTVTSVKSTREGNGDSILGVRFDRVEMKDNRVMRIQGLIVAIGPAPTNETGLGYNSVLSRGGAGSTPELDPSIAADKYDKDKPELAKGSALEGIALAVHFDPDGATLIRGVHREIKLNSDVMVRIALYRSK
jgi:hypothetical protein